MARLFLAGSRNNSFNLETRLKHDALVQSHIARPKVGGAYRPVDCDALLGEARAARRRDGERLERVQRLCRRGKLVREGGLLRAHKDAWQNEQSRLDAERKQIEKELMEWRERAGSSRGQFWRHFLSDTAAEEAKLSIERQVFTQHTLQQLRTVQSLLKSTLRPPRHEKGEGKKEALESVKRQQKVVMEALRQEFDHVLDEVTHIMDGQLKHEQEECRVIPLELLNEKEGVDMASYQTALKELQLLDNHYSHSLDSLDHHYQPVIGLKNGGWSLEEAEKFSHIVGQYPTSLMKRRTLLIDRLIREFPQQPRAEIVSHETWFCAMLYYHRHQVALITSWRHHRAVLVQRLVAVLREQRQLSQAHHLTSADRAEQQRRAEELYHKVQEWREEREAAMRREEAEREREREREEEERQREELKMAEHRDKLRAKVAVYHGQLDRAAETEKEKEEGRRKQREVERRQEGRRRRERVDHRQQLLRERQLREEEAKERAMEAVRGREKRLDQLRQTVEVKATHDPQRLMRATRASEMHRSGVTDVQLDIQHPLFTVHGYHDDVVTSDPRFRVAAALQKAGLLGTSYARHVFASIPPPQCPRPDQSSSVFNYNQQSSL